MKIEYSIKLEKDKLIILQQLEGDASFASAKPQNALQQNVLPRTYSASEAATAANATSLTGGNPPVSKPGDPGGSPFTSSSAPITLIGPFVFLCPDHDK